MPKVVNGLSWKFVCKMGMGPMTNLYNIGGDPLTHLNFFNYIFLKFFLLQKKRWQWENERKIFCRWPTDPLMQSIKHSSLSTALVINPRYQRWHQLFIQYIHPRYHYQCCHQLYTYVLRYHHQHWALTSWIIIRFALNIIGRTAAQHAYF